MKNEQWKMIDGKCPGLLPSVPEFEVNAHHRDTKNTEVAQSSRAATDTAKGFDTIIGSLLHSRGVKYL